jgi:outer membrane biosynthesis protein TonB
VGPQGEIQDAAVMCGPPMLRDVALDAVWQWSFKPALAKGKPIAVWVAIPVKFTLHN